MEVSKAIKKTIKNRTKILFKKAIKDIKKACKKGEYGCKIEVVSFNKDEVHAMIINSKLIDKLSDIGYSIGSTVATDKGDVKNIFWKEKKQIS